MGIFWSCCEDNEGVCIRCNRRGLQLTNNECQSCRNNRIATAVETNYIRFLHVSRPNVSNTQSYNQERIYVHRSTPAYRPPVVAKATTPRPTCVIPKKEPRKPLFGQFRCSCGRKWNSRRSWHDNYQICKSCRKPVKAYTQRELRTEDMEERSRAVAMQDHPEDLCQMCKELGYYCGKYKC